MISKIAIALFLTQLVLFGGRHAGAEEARHLGDIKGEATDIKGEATDEDHKDWMIDLLMVNLGDIKGEATDVEHIKGEATDEDHKDWVVLQVMMGSDLVAMGFTAEEAGEIVGFTIQGWHIEKF